MSQDHSGYPLPSYATTIWLASDHLCVALPSGPNGKAHTVRIPLAKCSIEQSEGGSTLGRQLGWQALLEILKTRAAAASRPVRLGDRAAPVQYDLDAMLRAVSTTPSTPKVFSNRGVRQLSYSELFEDQDAIPSD